jgi:hypothetical protein
VVRQRQAAAVLEEKITRKTDPENCFLLLTSPFRVLLIAIPRGFAEKIKK